MMIEVTKIKYLGGYSLHATFSDGIAGEHDFSLLVAESGPMTWPNGFDMCPDWLRREIEGTGALAPDIRA